jgi:TPR repeat protein
MAQLATKHRASLILLALLIIGIISYFGYEHIEKENRFTKAYEIYKIKDSIDVKSLTPLSESHHPKSSVLLGLYHLKNGDTSKSMVLFQKAIDDGDKIYGSLHMALCAGDAFIKLWWSENFNKALELAEHGDWLMQWHLASIINSRSYVENRDTTLAFKLLEKSATAGSTKSCLLLGVWNYEGTCCKINEEEALKWYKKAADNGNAVGTKLIGDFYTLGKGGLKSSYELGMKYYKIAASKGNTDAQYAISIMYRNGMGVKPNISESLTWAKLAAKNGNIPATQFLESHNKNQALKKANRFAQNSQNESSGYCALCYGSGYITCTKCKGTRIVGCWQCGGKGFLITTYPNVRDCYLCEGSGESRCLHCLDEKRGYELCYGCLGNGTDWARRR